MKRIIIFSVALMIAVSAFCQEPFNGVVKIWQSLKYETDEATIIAQANKNIDEQVKNKKIDAATATLAKAFTKPIVKKTLKNMQFSQYVTNFPDGEYNVYMYIDSKNNRTISFCPELGRVIMIEKNTGTQAVCFPKYKIGWVVRDDDGVKKAEPCAEYVGTPRTPDMKIEMINGFESVEGYACFKYEDVGGEMVDTVTIDGVLMVKVPTGNMFHADYNKLTVQGNSSTEYLTIERKLSEMNAGNVDAANFVVPEGYTWCKNNEELAKKVKKILKKDSLAIPFDGTLPSVVWSMFTNL